LICFGLDGVEVFIRLQTDVAIQFKSKATPFVIVVHYMAHEMNLIDLQTFIVQPLVGKLEGLL
jgi:hypothetical protein